MIRVRLYSEVKKIDRIYEYSLAVGMEFQITKSRFLSRNIIETKTKCVHSDYFDSEEELIKMVEDSGGIEEYMKENFIKEVAKVCGDVVEELEIYNNKSVYLDIDRETLDLLMESKH